MSRRLLSVALAAVAVAARFGSAEGPSPVPVVPEAAAHREPAVPPQGNASPPPANQEQDSSSLAVVPHRCPDPRDHLIVDLRVRQAAPISEPPARSPVRDSVFGSCLTRVTDRDRDFPEGVASPGMRNEYSRVQSFNADGSRILVRGVEGSAYLYDATTLQPLARLELDGVDPRWDASDPNLLYAFAETRLVRFDVRTGRQTTVHDFAADFPGQRLAAVWTRYEGSSSLDGSLWGLMAEDESWETVGFIVYDQRTDRVIATRDLRGVPGAADIDSVTISPLGTHFLADFSDHYCERGTLGTDAHPCGLMVYDRDLRNGRGLFRIAGHADLALDAERREVLVFQDLDNDTISLLDLATGTVTPLWPIDFSHTAVGLHFSGRALQRPGWAVVSTYNGGRPVAHTWMDDQVFLVELKSGGRVVRLAHTRSIYSEEGGQDYWAEPHASANQDLTRIVFTSNWGRTGTEEVEMFMIDLPADWPQRLPRPD